jgi:hypothetical protein
MHRRGSIENNVLFLILGLVLVAVGIWQLLWPDDTCRGSAIPGTDSCYQAGTWLGGSSTRVMTAADRRSQSRMDAIFVLPIGIAIIWINVRSLNRRRLRAGPVSYGRRRQLAAANGWTYREADPTVLHGWGRDAQLESTSTATAVVSGARNGVRFDVFDFTDRTGPHTAWVVYAPDWTPSGALAQWTSAGVRLDRAPLHQVTVADRKIADVTDGLLHELDDKELLRPLERLTQIVNRHLGDSSAVSTR